MNQNSHSTWSENLGLVNMVLDCGDVFPRLGRGNANALQSSPATSRCRVAS